MLAGGETKETPETPAAEARTNEPNSEAAQPDGQEQPGQSAADRDSSGKFVKKTPAGDEPVADEEVPLSVQKRIDKITKQKAESDRKIADLEAKLANQGSRPATETAQPAAEAPAKPKVEDFEKYEDYVEALTDWKADERDRQRSVQAEQAKAAAAHKTVLDAHASRIAEASKADDWDEVVEKANGLACSQAAHHAVIESEVGPDVIRWLVEHPEESAKFSQLSATRQVAEIGRIEERVIASKAPATPASKSPALPRPPRHVGGSATAKQPSLTDRDIDMSTFKRLAKAALNRNR